MTLSDSHLVELEGKRIRLIDMPDDPDPIESGTTGTILWANEFAGAVNIVVDWDSSRTLGLVVPPDTYEIIS